MIHSLQLCASSDVEADGTSKHGQQPGHCLSLQWGDILTITFHLAKQAGLPEDWPDRRMNPPGKSDSPASRRNK